MLEGNTDLRGGIAGHVPEGMTENEAEDPHSARENLLEKKKAAKQKTV